MSIYFVLHRLFDYKILVCQTPCGLLLNANDLEFKRLNPYPFFLFAVAGNYDDAIIAQVDNIQKEVLLSEFKMKKGISFQFLILFYSFSKTLFCTQV